MVICSCMILLFPPRKHHACEAGYCLASALTSALQYVLKAQKSSMLPGTTCFNGGSVGTAELQGVTTSCVFMQLR